MKDFANIASVRRKLGDNGEVEVKMIPPHIFFVKNNATVFLTPPPLYGIYETLVENVRPLKKGWGVKFADSNNAKDAFSLVGRTCLVKMSDIEENINENNEQTIMLEHMMGKRVFNVLNHADTIEKGVPFAYIGDVKEVIANPAHPIVVVKEARTKESILIPFVKEYFPEYEKQATTNGIIIDVPTELLNLNKKESENAN